MLRNQISIISHEKLLSENSILQKIQDFIVCIVCKDWTIASGMAVQKASC